MLDYDPLLPEIQKNPYPYYRRLREEAPAYYAEKYNTWFLSRFQDIWNAERDFRDFTIAEGQMPTQVMGMEDIREQREVEFGNGLASLDPPAHTSRRSALAPRFRPGSADALRARTRELVRGFLDEFAGRGEACVVNDLAMRTSVRIACTIIGFPLDMAQWFVERINMMFIREEGTLERNEATLQGLAELHLYIDEFIHERRRRGGDHNDALQALLDLEIDGEKLSHVDVLADVNTMLVGGTETLPKAFSGAVYRLYQNPDQRAECVANPALIPGAFQEALRYDMPTQMLGRRLVREREVQGHTLKPGQGVLYLWASGNRDEREFPNGERFDIHRNAPRILTFGAGPHMCLGAHMARMEGEVMLEELLARIPEYEVIEERAVRIRSELFQGYIELPIRFAPS